MQGMRVGVYTRYLKEEITYAALRVAELARHHGAVRVACPTNRGARGIHPYWDGKTQMLEGTDDFRNWSESCDTVITTELLPSSQLHWALKNRIQTVFIPSWDELTELDIYDAESYGKVITPSVACRNLFTTYGQENTECIRWDSGLPYTRKPETRLPGPVRLFFPLGCVRPARIDEHVLAMIGDVLAATDVTVTLAYVPSHWATAIKRSLKRLIDRYKRRVQIADRCTPDQLSMYFGAHDLTVLPTRRANTCLAAIVSMTMGTPVFAFDVDPLSEFINLKNGFLVPTEVQPTEIGVPVAPAQYETFRDHLIATVTNLDAINACSRSTEIGHAQRAKMFDDKWLVVLR